MEQYMTLKMKEKNEVEAKYLFTSCPGKASSVIIR